MLARIIAEPVPASWAGVTPLMEPAVPTGMNTGVSTHPCGVANTPHRAAPCECVISNPNMPGHASARRGTRQRATRDREDRRDAGAGEIRFGLEAKTPAARKRPVLRAESQSGKSLSYKDLRR